MDYWKYIARVHYGLYNNRSDIADSFGIMKMNKPYSKTLTGIEPFLDNVKIEEGLK